MGQQGEFLEHHRHLLLLQTAQVRGERLCCVFAIQQDLARCGFDQAIQVADQCRFVRPGQAHEHGRFASLHINMDIP